MEEEKVEALIGKKVKMVFVTDPSKSIRGFVMDVYKGRKTKESFIVIEEKRSSFSDFPVRNIKSVEIIS